MCSASSSDECFNNISNLDITMKQFRDIVKSMLLSFDDSQMTFHIDTKPLEVLCIIVTERFIKFL
jgi:hypothetical protein